MTAQAQIDALMERYRAHLQWQGVDAQNVRRELYRDASNLYFQERGSR
jgi:hypothetical protein